MLTGKIIALSSGFGGPSGIPSPKDWLLNLNPGYGPATSLGLDFFTHNLVSFLINGALLLAIISSLIALIIGGIMWMINGGNKEGLAKAKNTITYALIGLALALSALIIINLLGQLFGINLTGSVPATVGF